MTAPTYKWQPTSVEIARDAGIPIEDVIRFDHNTSPVHPDWALDVITPLASNLNEYPGASYRPIRDAAATFTGLEPEQIMPGAGIDELILLIGRALLGPGRTAVTVAPTYPLYEIATRQVGSSFLAIPAAAPGFDFPVDEVVDAARDADLVWLCIPSNPIGTTIPFEVVEMIIAATDGTVVIDAAYAEFDEALPDWSSLVDRRHNVLVLRTMSKGFGLAGIRVGYAMAHPSLVTALDGVRPPGSIASLSVELAIAALEDPDRMRESVAYVAKQRVDLAGSLIEIGLKPMTSTTNFLLCPVGPEATRIADDARSRGLVIRTFPGGPLTEHLRFTVRAPHEHDRLIASLRRSLR
jgi:histidinol-phosphate aminotransferase